MINDAAVDAAAAAWNSAWENLVAASPEPSVSRRGPRGTRVSFNDTGNPVSNGVVSVEAVPDLGEIAEFAAAHAERELPWNIKLRGEPDPRIVTLATAYGLTSKSREPFMLRPADAGEVLPGSDELRIRTVLGEEYLYYLDVMAACRGVAPEKLAQFATPGIVGTPGVSAYVGEVGGVPVATGLGVLAEDHIGVFNIATLPSHRRRGYGRLMTTAVLRDGYRAGAHTALLHPTDMSRSLYESIDFRTAEYWTTLAAPE
jgi:ribosomal protein S18 acetylase RimI-like enzyme